MNSQESHSDDVAFGHIIREILARLKYEVTSPSPRRPATLSLRERCCLAKPVIEKLS